MIEIARSRQLEDMSTPSDLARSSISLVFIASARRTIAAKRASSVHSIRPAPFCNSTSRCDLAIAFLIAAAMDPPPWTRAALTPWTPPSLIFQHAEASAQEFIRFLNQIEAQVSVKKAVRVVLDIYATHKYPKVGKWIDRHPRFTFHFTPTSSSWLNAVEGFFAKLSRRRLNARLPIGPRTQGRPQPLPRRNQ
ncbi:transposase [Bradyrhizobium sp. LM3.4]